MNFYDKIQRLLNEEAKNIKENNNKKKVNLNLVIDVSDDSDFEDVRPINVMMNKERNVKKIINNHIDNKKMNEKIDLKLISNSVISHLVKKRKHLKRKHLKRKLTKKRIIVCDHQVENTYTYKPRKNVLKESNLYKDLLKKENELEFYWVNRMIFNELMNDTINCYKRIDFKNYKIEEEVNNIIIDDDILHEEPDYSAVASDPKEENEFKAFIKFIIQRLIWKIRGDEIIINQREGVINDFVNRALYWMDRAYKDERIIDELKKGK